MLWLYGYVLSVEKENGSGRWLWITDQNSMRGAIEIKLITIIIIITALDDAIPAERDRWREEKDKKLEREWQVVTHIRGVRRRGRGGEKWQVTAPDEITALKSDSNKIIGSQRLWQNLIGSAKGVNNWLRAGWVRRGKTKICSFIFLDYTLQFCFEHAF